MTTRTATSPGAVGALTLAAIVLMGSGSASLAKPGTLRITLTAEKTQLTFELGAVFHTVHGKGLIDDAVLTYSADTGELIGSIGLAAAGVTTENQRRDHKMHQQVLKSAEHPRIALILRRADGDLNTTTGGALQIEADLELLGEPHPLSFPVEITILDPESGSFRASGAFSVPYVAWGLEDPSSVFLRVDQEVQVTFSTGGILGPETSP
jgi:hypothetical protein